jgi:PEP-CTERM motif
MARACSSWKRVALATLLVTAPAAARGAMIVGGATNVYSTVFSCSPCVTTDVTVGGIHWNGSTGAGATSVFGGLAIAPNVSIDPPLHYVGTVSNTDGTPTSTGETGAGWLLQDTNLDLQADTFVWSPGVDPSLTHYDPFAEAADPAMLSIGGVVPFQWSGTPSGSSTVSGTVSFDLVTSKPVFGPDDFLQISACLVSGSTVDAFWASDATLCTANAGSYLDFGTFGGGTPGSFSHSRTLSGSIPNNTRFTAMFAIGMGIKNDTGPVSMSLENFNYLTAVPEPGTLLLMALGFGVLGIRGREGSVRSA